MAKTLAVDPCPCGGAAGYEACCGRFHAGALHLMAPTAEALMRSRYAAYVFGLDAYLLDTWHPSTRPLDIAPPPPGLRWIGLEVRHHVPIDADHAAVGFVARSKLGGRADRMRVTSRFERVGGRWLYVEDVSDP
jgi:SEC-C motif domain protein